MLPLLLVIFDERWQIIPKKAMHMLKAVLVSIYSFESLSFWNERMQLTKNPRRE
jgi:hypothetical protein